MLVFHVDANSAYLSWTAAALLESGYPVDLRTIPAAIAGDPENRHGIILTKSIPAKKFGVKTGESIFEAKQKCPELFLWPPDYDLFLLCSDAMHNILSEYTPLIQRYSVDECFMDMSNSVRIISKGGSAKGNENAANADSAGSTANAKTTGNIDREAAENLANEIRIRIKNELGFTVNIGIGENKLLAKMAGELKKPDMVHTIWPDEIEKKLWPLPVSELFMVGRATTRKLEGFNIKTIGDLAKADRLFLKSMLKSHGLLVHDYANGIDDSPVVLNEDVAQKGVGNGTTFPYDLLTPDELFNEALALSERVGMRLRKIGRRAGLVSVHIRTNGLFGYSHQVKLGYSINTTSEIYDVACRLIKEMWKGEPVRHMGISVSDFTSKDEVQLLLFDTDSRENQEKLDKAVDAIRKRFGDRSIIRGTFANSGLDPILGGVNDGNYIMMGGGPKN